MRRTIANLSSGSLSLYGFPFSQPTRSIKLLLKQHNIPYEFKLVDALKGENRRPDFLKFHPAGVVPVIDDSGFILGETCAILQYLAETRDIKSLYPIDSKVRAKINFWMHWHHNNTRLSTKQVLVPSVLFPPKVNPSEVTQAGVKAYTRSMSFLENHLKQQGSSKFIAGTDNITIADLIIITELDQLKMGVFDLYDYSKNPSIVQYMGNVAKNLKYYDEILQPVIDLAKKKLGKS